MQDCPKYIGFDLGAESGRCIVAEIENKRIKLTEVYRFLTPNISYGGHFYWDVLAIYNEMVKGLSHAKKQFGSHFDGISVDTWGVDYVLLDADDRLLGYPHHYRDSRTDGLIEKSFQIVPKENIYKRTGTQFAQYNTLFQLLSEKNQKTNLLEFADKMLMIPDFLLFSLSGVKKGEYTIVSTSNLADPIKRDWAWDLIESFGLPKHIFPEVVEPGTLLGTIRPDLAEKTGINADTPIIASTSHDTGGAVAAVPAQEGNWAFTSSGTWSLMGIELSKPLINGQALEYNFTNEGGIRKTTQFLKNLIGLWPVQECRRYWLDKGQEYSYDQLAKKALDHGPAHAWLDLDDLRFLKAGYMPEKIISFLKETNQKFKEDIGFIIRCVVESLAFKYRSTIQELEEVTGKKIDRLHIVGGGIQNELLSQLTADALDCEVITGPIEGAIVGNIGVQAITTGAISDLQELRKIVAHSFDVKYYHPQQAEYFKKNEQHYHEIVKNKYS